MRFGLDENIIEKITKVFEDQPKVDKAYIFGSRAKGNYRPDSDIDIALKGYDLTVEDILKMSAAIEKERIGFEVDLVDYDSIKEAPLRGHIDRVGIQLYARWNDYKLTEMGSLERGKSRHRPRYAFQLYGGNYPFIQTGDIAEASKYITTYRQTYSEAGLQQSRLWKKGTLCITIAANIAETAILGIDACFPDSVIGFIPDERKTDLDYVFYVLRHFQRQIQQFGDGSVQDNINLGTFEKIKFPFPPLIEQKTIANILNNLDDKIDLLHRQNKTLESMAETLFRQSFIEQAKDDWDENNLAEYIWFDPREKIDRNTLRQFFEMKCLSNIDMNISSGELRIASSGSVFRNDDTLLAKITPCLENGKTGFVMQLANDEIAMGSTEFIVMRSKGLVSPYWIYCLARSEEFRDNAILSMTGTSGRQRVQIDLLRSIRVRVDITVMKHFHQKVTPMFAKIKSNQIQIHSLENLRNALLPKLLSGEARVKMS